MTRRILRPVRGAVVAARRLPALDSRLDRSTRWIERTARSLRNARPADIHSTKPYPSENGPIKVALLGAGGHGAKHIDQFLADPRCQLTYICDADSARADRAAAKVGTSSGATPAVTADVREVLADDAVDVVSVATPHHWHAPAAIWAARAGKHVYLEKPTTHVHSEAASLEAAAEKYPVLIQSGTQLRSNSSLERAAEFMQSGGIGDVDVVHCITYKRRPQLPPTGPVAVPSTVDLDLYCGPAPLVEPSRSKFHYHWHWFWDFGNGALGNNGVHRMDVARIGLDLRGFGDQVFSYGGRFGAPDAAQTPNTNVVVHRFDQTFVVQEVLGLPTGSKYGFANGIVFHGTKGSIVYTAGTAALVDADGAVVQPFAGEQENHFRNFVSAVESGGGAGSSGSLREGNLSSSLCHLGNISYRVGQQESDSDIDDIVAGMGAPEAIRSMRQRARWSIEANGFDGDMVAGATLDLTDDGSVISGNPAASGLLTKTYREPYSVPPPHLV